MLKESSITVKLRRVEEVCYYATCDANKIFTHTVSIDAYKDAVDAVQDTVHLELLKVFNIELVIR